MLKEFIEITSGGELTICPKCSPIQCWLHFKTDEITPNPSKMGGSNSCRFQCAAVKWRGEKVEVAFHPSSLSEKEVMRVLTNRTLEKYGDSSNQYIQIPLSELYSVYATPVE